MSTGDVRRPSLSKLAAKAAATDKPEPDTIDSDESDAAESEPTDKAPVKTAGTRSAVTKARAAGVKASGAKASGTKATGAKSAGAKTAGPKTPVKSAGTRAGARPGSRGPVKAGGGKGRKPGAPVRVKAGVNWGPIAMFTVAGLAALAIIGFGGYSVWKDAHKPSWQDRAAAIPGIHNYLKTNPAWFVVPAGGNHKAGVLTYPTSPPVGGIHNPQWQDCMGDVYTAEIPKEQGTHSLEHGAVWIAYRPDLPKDQVDKLASKVRNQPFMLMSPYPGLDAPISLQAWGYQLKLDNAGDSRIDSFIDALRQNATQEPQAGCSNGITDTGTTPLDMAPLPTA
jgi:Protein of unknown function (DUF3105)